MSFKGRLNVSAENNNKQIVSVSYLYCLKNNTLNRKKAYKQSYLKPHKRPLTDLP